MRYAGMDKASSHMGGFSRGGSSGERKASFRTL